jgi:hypothetical protein
MVFERPGRDQADAVLVDRPPDLRPRQAFVEQRRRPRHGAINPFLAALPSTASARRSSEA